MRGVLDGRPVGEWVTKWQPDLDYIRTGLFTDRDRDLLTTFASQAAVLIENARLFENVTGAKTLMDNVFSSIASGVITRDTEGVITLFNRAAGEILQVPQ